MSINPLISKQSMLNFFKTSKETAFWNWFLKNKSKIEAFVHSDFSDYTIYNRLTKKLRAYDNRLFPELTTVDGDKYVLIITPDKDEKGNAPTRKLYDAKPLIDDWIVKKYRQPCDRIDLNFNGVAFPSSDMESIPTFEDPDRVDIAVFVRNFNRDKINYRSLAFLYLDHILGEFNSITKLRYVDFYHLDENQTVENSNSVLELRKMIEEKLY